MCTARPNWLSLSTTFFNKEECHKVSLIMSTIMSIIMSTIMSTTFFNKEECHKVNFTVVMIVLPYPGAPSPL